LKCHIITAHSVRRREKKAQKLNLSGKGISEANPTAKESSCKGLATSKWSNPNKMEIKTHSQKVKHNRSNEAVKEVSPKTELKIIPIRRKVNSRADVKRRKRSNKRYLSVAFPADKEPLKGNECILLKQSKDDSFCLNSSDVQTSTPSSTGSLKLSFRKDREKGNWSIVNKSKNTSREDDDEKENDVERQIEALQKQSETLRTQIEKMNASMKIENSEDTRVDENNQISNEISHEMSNETAFATPGESSDDEEDDVKMTNNLDPALFLSFGEEVIKEYSSETEVDEDGSDDDEEETGETDVVEEISLLTDDEVEIVTSQKRMSSVVLESVSKRNRTYVATNVTFERTTSRPSFARLSLGRGQSFITTASHNNNRKASFRREVIEVARYRPNRSLEPQTSIVPFEIGQTEMLKMRGKSSSLKSRKIVAKKFKTKKLSREGNSREFFGLGPRDSMVIVEENYEVTENNFPVVGPYMCEICRTFVKTNREFVRHVEENHQNELDEDVLQIMKSQLAI